MAAGGSPPRRGWFYSRANARLEARYNNTVFLRGTGTTLTLPLTTTASGALTSTSPTGGVGYGVGAGAATVTQATNRTTTVVIATATGSITTSTASLAAETSAAFTVTAPVVGINDVIVLSKRSGSNGGNTDVTVSAVAAGSFQIMVSNDNASGGTAETGAIIINYAVIKGSAT